MQYLGRQHMYAAKAVERGIALRGGPHQPTDAVERYTWTLSKPLDLLADPFISYAREDRERIEQLASALESTGLSVWWDRNISGGAEFSTTIQNELIVASHAIVA